MTVRWGDRVLGRLWVRVRFRVQILVCVPVRLLPHSYVLPLIGSVLYHSRMLAQSLRRVGLVHARLCFDLHACFQPSVYSQLGQIFTQQEDYKSAIDVYLEALEFSPENPEILTTIGLLYLRLGENFRAFDFLGNSLTHDPKNPKTILAAGSIIQVHFRVLPCSKTYFTFSLSYASCAQV